MFYCHNCIYFWPLRVASGISVPISVKTPSPNYWTTSKFPVVRILNDLIVLGPMRLAYSVIWNLIVLKRQKQLSD